jgi:hypothetical protein
MTKLGNSLPRKGDAIDPFSAWYGTDARPNRILDYLQPFGRIAYVTDRTKINAKADVRALKCVFVGYANDHSGDTYKFYNPTTKHTILSRDVHQWMEWHGRITATDDLALFDELDRLKTESWKTSSSATHGNSYRAASCQRIVTHYGWIFKIKLDGTMSPDP